MFSRPNLKILLAVLSAVVALLIIPAAAAAADVSTNSTSNCSAFFGLFNYTVTINGTPTTVNPVKGLPQICSPEQAIGNVVQLLLQFSAMIAVVFLMIGGFWYITAAGNEEQSEKGRKTITSAAIGLVVIIMAYAIVRITVNLLTTGLTGGNAAPTTTTSPGSGTNPGTTNPTGNTQTPANSNSMYSLLGPNDIIDTSRNHLAATTGVQWVNGGQGGLTAWSTVGSSDPQAIAEIKVACLNQGIDPPFLDIKISQADQNLQDYGQAPYVKQADGTWKATVTSTQSTGNATVLQYWICNGPQIMPVTIPGR